MGERNHQEGASLLVEPLLENPSPATSQPLAASWVVGGVLQNQLTQSEFELCKATNREGKHLPLPFPARTLVPLPAPTPVTSS